MFEDFSTSGCHLLSLLCIHRRQGSLPFLLSLGGGALRHGSSCISSGACLPETCFHKLLDPVLFQYAFCLLVVVCKSCWFGVMKAPGGREEAWGLPLFSCQKPISQHGVWALAAAANGKGWLWISPSVSQREGGAGTQLIHAPSL